MLKRLAYNRMALAMLAPAILVSTSIAFSQEGEEEVFELSPFEVDTTQDVGYLATNTLSGGRFNVNLGDTAASVSVFTQEFIDDFGIQDIDELSRYTLGTVIDTGDNDRSDNINQVVNAFRLVGAIRIRGIQATKGRNFYESITPDDGYRNGRYDESRGPNGILFGISNAGGMISSSTLQGNVYRDSLRLKYTTGSWGESRAEFQGNRVLIEDKLGIAIAGLHEDSEGWRTWMQDDRDYIYGAITFKPTDRITIRAMGETGDWNRIFFRPMPVVDNVSRWVDAGRPLAVPYGYNPSQDNALGGQTLDAGGGERWFNNITQNNQRNLGKDPRHVYIENIGELHNLSSTYVTAGYNDLIDQLPGRDGNVGDLRLNDPEMYPYELAFNGPDVFRRGNAKWFQIEADIRLTDSLYLNIGHNDQYADLEASYTAGNDPSLFGDPNVTLGVVQPDPLTWQDRPRVLNPPSQPEIDSNLNPFAGKLFLEADHRYQLRSADSKETRIALSYDLVTDSWLGNHRMAVAVSNRKVIDIQESMKLAFIGAPYNSNPLDNDNLIWNRTYITEGDFSTYAYRQTLLPYDRDARATLVVNDYTNPSALASRDAFDNDGVEREIGWVSEESFANSRTDQDIDAFVFVSQSNFINDRLVLTLGYREDTAIASEYGYYPLADNGYILDQTEPIKETEFKGESKAAGAVFHLTENLSLVANYATSIGLPTFNRSVLPEDFRANSRDTSIPPPPEGEGTDFGIAFKFFDNKINGRFVYYTTQSVNESTGGTFGPIARDTNEDILDFLRGILVPTNYSQDQWDEFEDNLTTTGDAAIQDTESEGYEFRLTANPTSNWRLSLNVSYTDRKTLNFYKRGISWLGYTYDENGLLADFMTQRDKEDTDPDNWENTVFTYTNPENLDPAGTAAKILALTAEASALDGVDYLNVENNVGSRSVGQVLWDRQYYRLNDRVRDATKRWSLRPWKANVYSTYDFKDGVLDGWSVGGGVRWQDANIIGGDDEGNEYEGVEIFETDFMLRYRQRLSRGNGTITYQLNIYNVFDDTDIIPQRLATTPDQMVPGPVDRGVAYTRFDLVEPRSFRISVTYSF